MIATAGLRNVASLLVVVAVLSGLSCLASATEDYQPSYYWSPQPGGADPVVQVVPLPSQPVTTDSFMYCPPPVISFPSASRTDPSGFDVSRYIMEQSLAIRDPEDVWLQSKLVNDVQTALHLSMSIGSFGAAPSLLSGLGLGTEIGKKVSPYGSQLRGGFDLVGEAASLVGIGASTGWGDFLHNTGAYVVDKTVFSGNFDPSRTVVTTGTIPMNHSWDDGYGRGYTCGSVDVTKSFQPDFGRYTESKVGSWTTVETWGIKDLRQFESQWNLPPPPRFDSFQTYTPYVPTYTPPMYMPPTYTYTPPPVYTPPTWQSR